MQGAHCFFDSPLGTIRLRSDGHALTELAFLDARPETGTMADDPLLQEAKEELAAYFKGTLKQFQVPVNPAGTDFQRRVWTELMSIPYAKTISYRELSVMLGDPLCIRAAASANGKNPIGIIVPCHRVIGSDGSLTGYAGGLWRKARLLELEGVLQVQPSLF